MRSSHTCLDLDYVNVGNDFRLNIVNVVRVCLGQSDGSSLRPMKRNPAGCCTCKYNGKRFIQGSGLRLVL